MIYSRGARHERLGVVLRRSALRWWSGNQRHFPWRETTDPYRLLIAETLLRQTQASRLSKPYTSFIKEYPNVSSLSNASRDELRKWFVPLGLVRRADLLIDAARAIQLHHDGRVPMDSVALRSLPGVGVYTASAIQCLAFGIRTPMIDEGSGRVLRRVLGMPEDGAAYADTKLRLETELLLPRNAFRDFNLALIDLAAAYCHPLNPDCVRCPLRPCCSNAKSNAMPTSEPLKGRSQARPARRSKLPGSPSIKVN